MSECAPKDARQKVVDLARLAELAETARQQGKAVALCHGVFDLLHLGHVKHLASARREGDVLFVTLTSDRFVNKGPGRPIFAENMRAEMLASLEYVDYVAVNHGPSAEPVLDLIKPDVYVKGSDYENPEEDITGKITQERNTVERHGGRLVFTRDITFSSSTLINRYLDVYDPPLRDFLNQLRDEDGEKEIFDLIGKVADYKVVMVGDTIIDEYIYVEAMGKAAKENMIATLYQDREVFAGGVIAAANHVAGFCAEVEVVTMLGDDDPHEDLVRRSVKPNVKLTIIHCPGRPTTRKTRFVERGYMRKLFEIYHMNDTPLDEGLSDKVADTIGDKVKSADVTIVTDFGHGMIGQKVMRSLVDKARFLAVNAQSNSGNHGFNLITKYSRADYICIDAPEARLAMSDKYSDIERVVGELLPSRVPCEKIVVTHGGKGCYAYSAPDSVIQVPAFTKTVIDTVGAGDAFFAVTAPLVAAGGDMKHVAFIGNAAGAVKVGIVGHRRSVEKVPLMRYVTTLLK